MSRWAHWQVTVFIQPSDVNHIWPPPYFEFETCFIPVVNEFPLLEESFDCLRFSKEWGLHLKRLGFVALKECDWA
ncbi:hypothetical protein HAX54_030429 [Datura stramonium]|uniref:Uncharacterized protein n=1 Tax=Datura stramonium TaxID=4076 RepID=A0ABS8SB62_DATST|nr:hypothetical protein [Datura stramonium]